MTLSTNTNPADQSQDTSSRRTTQDDPVFVFGSNLAGRHGKGAAKWALENRGAIYGQGVGPQGNSYAIPTKDEYLRVLSLEDIESYVGEFISYALDNPEKLFQLTPVGCGLAGYKREDIEPMFKGAPDNVNWPPEWS